MLHYNALLTHLLTFLQTDLNIFSIGAVMPWDPRSSTSKCEVFARRYGCQHKNMCLLEFANRIVHRCFRFYWLRSSSDWRIRRHLWQKKKVQPVSADLNARQNLSPT
jgi:hypothetical protein